MSGITRLLRMQAGHEAAAARPCGECGHALGSHIMPEPIFDPATGEYVGAGSGPVFSCSECDCEIRP